MKTKVLNITQLDVVSWKVERFVDGNTNLQKKFKFEMRSIAEVVKVRNENIIPNKEGAINYTYLGLENIEGSTGELNMQNETKSDKIKSVSKKFYEGDILYARLRPYLNKIYLAGGQIKEGVCSNEFYVLVPQKEVRPLFLRTILSSSIVLDHVKKLQAGAALPRIGLKDLLDIKIPVPPIKVQNIIEDQIKKQITVYREAAKTVKTLPNTMFKHFLEKLSED